MGVNVSAECSVRCVGGCEASVVESCLVGEEVGWTLHMHAWVVGGNHGCSCSKAVCTMLVITEAVSAQVEA